AVIPEESAAVGLQQATQLEFEVAVGRLEAEALVSGDDYRRFFLLCGRFFCSQLRFAVKHLDLLIKFLDQCPELFYFLAVIGMDQVAAKQDSASYQSLGNAFCLNFHDEPLSI